MGIAATLGEFVLEEPIGEGAMARVWRGRHRSGSPAAVKVLRNDATGPRDLWTAFRNEVRAAAGLDHPHIVRIHAHGRVPDAAHDPERGLVAGSPFLAMQLVPSGALPKKLSGLRWPELEGVLLATLDALSHAHARGVVHRDIKPGNILVGEERGEVWLTDFGLAMPFLGSGVDSLGRSLAGTPTFMAPEQLDVRWRDYGPWTDLFAVGCVAWAMVRGRSPFHGRSLEEVRRIHRERALPPFPRRFPVPDGFEAWVRTLIEPAPGDRFQCAADAAWALRRLRERTPSAPDLATLVHEGMTSDPSLEARSWTYAGRSAPMPAHWERAERRDPRADRRLGNSLLGLRRPPMVGRPRARQELWTALRTVRNTAEAQLVVVEGPGGSGRTRLADWLAERADELGAATVLRASHAPDPGPQDGLAAIVARQTRCGQLAHDEAVVRLRELLATLEPASEASESTALAQMIAPASIQHLRGLRGPDERFALVRRHLERLARRRPVLVVLDDAHRGAEALAFCEHLLARQEHDPAPILLVATVGFSDGAPADAIAALRAHDRCATIRLGPLSAGACRALAEGLVGDDRSVVGALLDAAGGRPSLLVQLASDWIDSGVLDGTADRLVFTTDAGARRSQGAERLWQARLKRLLALRRDDDARALEIAAVLGRDVLVNEWLRACAHAELAPSADMLDQLLELGLVRSHPGLAGSAFSFSESSLRDAVEAQAVAVEGLASAHLACAEMLGDGGTSFA